MVPTLSQYEALGCFFLNKFGLYVNLTKCKYVDGTSEGHARSLWEMNVI